MDIYVEMDGEDVISYHTKSQISALVKVIQDDPVFDPSKINGYKIVQKDDGYHMVFDDEKYASYSKNKERDEAIKKGEELLNDISNKNILESATDEEAYTMRYLYPEWSKDGVDYKKGQRVMYEDKFYKCLNGHTSQASWTPSDASSLFVEIPDPNVEYPEFKQPTMSEDAYQKNDKVTYKGKKYISLIDNNAWSPDDYPDGWKLVE